jgi:RNA polymerase sigma-70 factor (ECF subfamily)
VEARALVESLIGERARFVRLARLRVESEADADDIVQRALARASERAGALDDPSRARAWFYRILRRAIADHHRERRGDPMRQRSTVEPEDLASDDGPARNPCACGIRLLQEIRPAYAEVLRRVDMDGEDPAAAADALGISVGNLHVRLHRARRALREEVRHHCGVDSHRPCLDCTCDARRRCGS